MAVLLDEVVDAGYREVTWRGEDNRGRRVASGVYFYRARMGDHSSVRRLFLLK